MGVGVGRALGGVGMSLACTAGVLVLHAVFVLTATGQLVDDATLVGGSIGQRFTEGFAEAVLELVSVVTLLAAAAAVLVIGAVRRRLRRALLAVAVLVGPTVTTQVLKRWVLTRPDLADTSGAQLNSLPSGHTTSAAAVAAAVLVVLPPRARPLGALVGAVATAATGSATLALGWHRASDVVAAVLVVGAWTGLVAALIALRDRVTPLREHRGDRGERPAASGWRLVVPALVVAAAGMGAAAGAVVVALATSSLPVQGRAGLIAAYGGGVLAIAAASSAVFVATLVLLRPLPGGPAASSSPRTARAQDAARTGGAAAG